MTENITWTDRTDATTATGASTEWSKDQANPLKAWAVAPLQPLGAFDGSLILIDGTGSYDNFIMSANLIITFAESEHQEGNLHVVKIISDGTKTLTFIKPSNYELDTPKNLTNGATLASGRYTFAYIFKNGEIEVNMLTKQAIAAVIPTVSSMSVEDANPNDLLVNLSESCTFTNLGGTFRVDATPRALSAVSGSPGTVQTFTISGAPIENGQVLDFAYDLGTGDTIAVAAPNNELATFTATTVTNNVNPEIGLENVVWTDFINSSSPGPGDLISTTSSSWNGNAKGTKYLPSGEDGEIRQTLETISPAPNTAFGFNTTTTGAAKEDMEACIQVSSGGNYFWREESVNGDTGVAWAQNDIVRLIRTSDNVDMEKSSDGGDNWTPLHDFGTISGNLYVNGNIQSNTVTGIENAEQTTNFVTV